MSPSRNLSRVLGTLSFQHSLTLTHFIGGIHVGPTTLCGTRFQSVGSLLISPNKEVRVGESVPRWFGHFLCIGLEYATMKTFSLYYFNVYTSNILQQTATAF